MRARRRVPGPWLPGIDPTLTSGPHLTALGGGVAGILAVPWAAAVTPGTATALIAALTLLCAAVALGGLVLEHVRFLEQPALPAGVTAILVPHPAPPQTVEVIPGQAVPWSTPRGLAARTRLWADPERIGVTTWAHATRTWPRTGRDAVVAARVVVMNGSPLRVDLVDAAGKPHGSIWWWRFFRSTDRGPLAEFCTTAGLVLREEPWHRKMREAWPPADGIEDVSETLAKRSAVGFVQQAGALMIPSIVALAEADSQATALAATWYVLGGITLALGVALIVLAAFVGWGDHRPVR
ncbi:MAG: hypothetical protein HGA44_11050 [Cellulomonadaceae bacterium]|nr:hypothetical protein [Cellulomonadaceae bacterium]